jgi:hypothetical protein
MSDETGLASTVWPGGDLVKTDGFHVRYIDVERRQGSTDQASVYWLPKDARLLLVDVEETLAIINPNKWAEAHPSKIKAQPGALQALHDARQKQYHILYLGLQPQQPMGYRRIRGWVRGQLTDQVAMSPGPVLARTNYAAAHDADTARSQLLDNLRKRFSANAIAVVGRRESAGLSRAAGLKTILIGAEDAGEGIVRVASWAEVVAQLQP